MKAIITFYILFFFALKVNAQNTFQILYGTTEEYSTTFGFDALQTSGGDYVITGSTYNYSASGNDVFLLKTTSDGTMLWFKIYRVDVAGNYKGSEATAIKQTADGGFIVAGNTYGVFGYNDVYVFKTDSTGNVLWQRVYGGSQEDAVNAIEETGTGDFIVAGSTYSFGEGTPSFKNIYVLKLTSTGDIVWNNTYNSSIDDNDEAQAVQQTTDGNYILCGASTVGSPTHQDAMLLKLNSFDGSVLWSKTYGGISSNEIGYDVKQNADGGFLVAGRTNIITGSSPDCFLLKTDAAGNTIQWAKTYATADAANSEAAYSLIATAEGGYALYGDVFYSADSHRYELLIKTDNAGNVSWANQHGSGNNDYGNKILQSKDKGYLLTSFEIADFSFLGTTAHITKTDSNGVSGCNDSTVNITTASPDFVVSTGPAAIGAGSSAAGIETIIASDEFLPVTVLCKTPAPELKFVAFSGTNTNGKNVLAWRTKSELKSDYYNIERSVDRRHFVSIGKVNATYKTFSKLPYKFTDDKFIRGTNYYRIKAVHKTGNVTYSNIIRIGTSNSNLISISNTNTPGIFLIKSEEPYNAPYMEYNIFNSIGNKVYQGRLENAYGKINTTINLSFLNNGIYYVGFNTEEKITNSKIVIAH